MLLYKILAFLLNTAVGILVGALLLRIYMQGMRLSFSNPLGQLVLGFTDWLLLPLRKRHSALRPKGRWDWVALFIALLLCIAKVALLRAMLQPWSLSASVVQGFFELATSAAGLAVAVVLAYVVLSWIAPQHWLYSLLARLCAPLLQPLQRRLPTLGGIDFAPMLAVMALYIVLMVLEHMEAEILVRYLPLP